MSLSSGFMNLRRGAGGCSETSVTTNLRDVIFLKILIPVSVEFSFPQPPV